MLYIAVSIRTLSVKDGYIGFDGWNSYQGFPSYGIFENLQILVDPEKIGPQTYTRGKKRKIEGGRTQGTESMMLINLFDFDLSPLRLLPEIGHKPQPFPAYKGGLNRIHASGSD